MDAMITYCVDVSEDSKVAQRIQSALNAHDWKFEDGMGHGNFSSYIGRGKWKIFVLSKEGLQSDMLKPQYMSAMTESIDENRLYVIPALRGMKIQEVPDFIKWVTYLSSDEEDYEEWLIQTMKGEEMTMETRLPAGDVATGLAWGFVLNYLPIPLLGKCEDNTDLTDRIRKKLQEKALSSACIKKLYITTPKTCQPITIETNTEKYPNSDPLIENLGRLKTVKFTSSGTEDLMEQVRDFTQLCTTLIANQTFKEKVADIEKLCKVVHFDNDSKTVQENLLEEIRKDLSSAVNLVS